MLAIDYGVDYGKRSQAERGCAFPRILLTEEMKQIVVSMQMFALLGTQLVPWLHRVRLAPIGAMQDAE